MATEQQDQAPTETRNEASAEKRERRDGKYQGPPRTAEQIAGECGLTWGQKVRLKNEQPIGLDDAGKIIPGNPTRQTLVRWASRGFRGVKLEVVHAGRKIFTSVEACHRFLARCTALANCPGDAAAPADPMATADAAGVGEKGGQL